VATAETVPPAQKSETQLTELQVEQLPHHTVKLKKPLQRSCNVKDEKGKICGGHLKRWFYATDIVEQECGDAMQAWGPKREVYRCEHCRTLYLPNPADPKSPSVAGKGMASVVRPTAPAKDK
jgi:hypothetical protein